LSQKSPSKSPNPVEIVIMTILGLISLAGVSGVFLSFVPSSQTGEPNMALAPACLGMTFAGMTSILMIWLRKRTTSASAAFAIGVILWFIGVNILGWGGFGVLNSNDKTFAENLGFSLALCFAPGGILSLLGLAFYGYDYRRNRQMTVATDDLAVPVPTEMTQDWNDTLRRAKEYRKQIDKLLKQKKGSILASQLTQITTNLNQWLAHLEELVKSLHDFKSDQISQRDIRDVPVMIALLEEQLEAEDDPQVRKEILETLARSQDHQRQLDSLVKVMRRTELDIDETLAAIGAIYSQLQLLEAKDIDNQRASRLSADIDEQVHRLDDLIEAMDDVYDSTTDP